MKRTAPPPHDFESFAKATILRMRDELLAGCRLDLTTAFALHSIGAFAQLGNKPPCLHMLVSDRAMILHALNVAIGFYESDDVQANIGDAAAETWRTALLEVAARYRGSN